MAPPSVGADQGGDARGEHAARSQHGRAAGDSAERRAERHAMAARRVPAHAIAAFAAALGQAHVGKASMVVSCSKPQMRGTLQASSARRVRQQSGIALIGVELGPGAGHELGFAVLRVLEARTTRMRVDYRRQLAAK